MDQRALPAPEEPERPRGRHEAPRRRGVGGPAGAAIAIVVAAVAFAGVLATWLIGSAEEAPDEAAGAVAATTQGGRPHGRPGRRRSATWSPTGASSRT
jgi:hypothetical protein